MKSIRDYFELKDSDTETIAAFVKTRPHFEKLAKSIIETGEHVNGVVLINESEIARLGAAKTIS